MFEKVTPRHPDKIADRIAGAIVDVAYKKDENPRIAVEVQLGHGKCSVVIESSVTITRDEVKAILWRLSDAPMDLQYYATYQDPRLASNQMRGIRCGDNGIFKGVPVTSEQKLLTELVERTYDDYESDGKYIIADDRIIVCQSHMTDYDAELWKAMARERDTHRKAIINPLGYWEGGTGVDTGATNRKLGSDMGDAVTGGGLHGKDLSKADVSVNIWCHLEAQRTGKEVTACCAIGDTEVNGVPYEKIVEVAREYITRVGGFEKFAEWGLIR